MNTPRILCAAFLLGASGLASAVPVNFLANSGFESPNVSLTPPNYATSIAGVGAAGASSAQNWNLYNNTAPQTDNELLASTDVITSGGSYMSHIRSGGISNGLYQVFAGISGFTVEADVYVARGSAVISAFSGGGTSLVASTVTTGTGQWEHLVIPFLNAFTDEIVVYSNASGADFYVDNVWVSNETRPIATPSIPEPGTLALLVAGLLVSAPIPLRRGTTRHGR